MCFVDFNEPNASFSHFIADPFDPHVTSITEMLVPPALSLFFFLDSPVLLALLYIGHGHHDQSFYSTLFTYIPQVVYVYFVSNRLLVPN